MKAQKVVAGILALAVLGLAGCGGGEKFVFPTTDPSSTGTPMTTPPNNVPANPSGSGITPGKFHIGNMQIGSSADLEINIYNADTTPTKYLLLYVAPGDTSDSEYFGYTFPPTVAESWVSFPSNIVEVAAKSWYKVVANLSIPTSYKSTLPAKWEFIIGVTEVWASPLTVSANGSSETLQVVSTADFPAAGSCYIGKDLYNYTGKDATHLLGIKCTSVFPVVHQAGEQVWRQGFVMTMYGSKVFVEMK